ncbi:MAG: PIN domain-containing protein [Nanoarchaeota archaeon]
MKLIVNTNRIIAALIKDSLSRRIITHINAELLTVNFSEKEIEKYKGIILKKANINEMEFKILFNQLQTKLIILDDNLISLKMEEAGKIMDNVDPADSPFIAAALATNSDIWSDDKHFEKQNRVKVWKTNDLAKFV